MWGRGRWRIPERDPPPTPPILHALAHTNRQTCNISLKHTDAQRVLFYCLPFKLAKTKLRQVHPQYISALHSVLAHELTSHLISRPVSLTSPFTDHPNRPTENTQITPPCGTKTGTMWITIASLFTGPHMLTQDGENDMAPYVNTYLTFVRLTARLVSLSCPLSKT